MEIDLQHIAKLAQLKLEEDKLAQFETQMKDIIGMVEKLPPLEDELIQVDVQHVMQLREDVVRDSLRRDEVLRNAPATQAGCVVVPKTVE